MCFQEKVWEVTALGRRDSRDQEMQSPRLLEE